MGFGVGLGMVALGTAQSFWGYKGNQSKPAYEGNAPAPVKDSMYEFSDFGYKSTSSLSYTVNSVTMGDVDGDGDQDIIMGVRRTDNHPQDKGGILVIENKMPQKNSNNKK